MHIIFLFNTNLFNKTRFGTITLLEELKNEVLVSASGLMITISERIKEIQEESSGTINDIRNKAEKIRPSTRDRIKEVRKQVRITMITIIFR